MGISSHLQSRLSMTRSDVTIALFIAAVTIIGVVYIMFFDSRQIPTERRELLLLEHRHDSVMAARKSAPTAVLNQSLSADSVGAWSPLTAADAALDSVADAPRSSSSGKKQTPTAPVNINTAAKSALMQLPGVGEKTAETIIAYRTHLPFRKVEDIMNVKGIGDKKFEKMRPYITVR